MHLINSSFFLLASQGQGRFAVLNNPHDQLMSVGTHPLSKLAVYRTGHECVRLRFSMMEALPGKGFAPLVLAMLTTLRVALCDPGPVIYDGQLAT